MVNPKKWVIIDNLFYIIIIAVFVIIICWVSTLQPDPSKVPYAVAGMVTMSGVMATFIGFWLVRFVPANKELEKAFSNMEKGLTLLVVFGLVIVIIGLNVLVFKTEQMAYVLVLIGTAAITITLILIMYQLAFSEIQYSTSKNDEVLTSKET